MSNELNSYEGLAEDFFAPLFDFFAPNSYREPRAAKGGSMKTDIKTVGDDYLMEVELPGVKKEGIDIDLQNGYLTIKAQKNRVKDDDEAKTSYIHSERFYGSVSRAYYVGDVDQKDVQAHFENGVLSLRFPKEKKPEPATRIAIQ